MNYIERMHEGRPKEELDAWLEHLKEIGITDEKIKKWDEQHQAVMKALEANKVQKEWDDMNANWESRKEEFLNSASTTKNEE
jgi:hypothetical protein